jgi:SAM-dependent methyltransferase
VEFYVRVNALLLEAGEDAVVLDFGAGRGASADDSVPFRRDLQRLSGRGNRVVGVDVDPGVLKNPTLDQALVVRPDERLPVDTASIDLILSDFTFEHLTNAEWAASELDRVLRPGGWLCARTPNRWGYIGLGARVVPNRLHLGLLRRLQPARRTEDTFPTVYRLNTPAALRRYFPPDMYDHIVYAATCEPTYVGDSLLAAQFGRLVLALTPRPFRPVLFVFLQKM